MKADTIIDGHKIHLHPEKVAEWKKTGDCYPIHIEIGVTGRCDQRCVFCALDFVKHPEDIDKDVMLRSLKNMAKHKVNSVMFGGEGEPLLHKDIGLFVQKAKEYGIDVALTTNGVSFSESKREQCLPYLSWIKYSVDAGTKEDYGKIHKTNPDNFEKLLNNIKESVEFKKKDNLDVTIGTQFLVIPQSMSNAPKLIERLNDIQPDYLVIKPYSDHPRSKKDLCVNVKDYNQLENRLKKSNANFKVEFREATAERVEKGMPYSECYGLPFISLIDSEGNILPCNLFYDKPEFIYGNLYEKSFNEIWKSRKRKKVLKKIKEQGIEGCRHACRCDAGNRYLDRIKHPLAHDNFT